MLSQRPLASTAPIGVYIISPDIFLGIADIFLPGACLQDRTDRDGKGNLPQNGEFSAGISGRSLLTDNGADSFTNAAKNNLLPTLHKNRLMILCSTLKGNHNRLNIKTRILWQENVKFAENPRSAEII
jgi:hypothetical protein